MKPARGATSAVPCELLDERGPLRHVAGLEAAGKPGRGVEDQHAGVAVRDDQYAGTQGDPVCCTDSRHAGQDRRTVEPREVDDRRADVAAGFGVGDGRNRFPEVAITEIQSKTNFPEPRKRDLQESRRKGVCPSSSRFGAIPHSGTNSARKSACPHFAGLGACPLFG